MSDNWDPTWEPDTTPAPAPTPCLPLADGWHRDIRWHVQAIEGSGSWLLTISGWVGPRWVYEPVELHQVTKASAEAFIDRYLDAPAKAKRK